MKSSSTTRALHPFSSGISATSLPPVERRKVMETVNSVPTSCLLRTWMLPFIMSTMFFVMAMPRPVPWMPLVVEFRSRSKGSKMCFTNSGDIPMPVSLIWNS